MFFCEGGGGSDFVGGGLLGFGVVWGGGGGGERGWGSVCERKMGWVCVLGRERFNRKLKCHKGSF